MSSFPVLHLKPELADTVIAAARFRGMSVERYVEEVVSIAAKLDADLAADLLEADEDLAAGRFYTQEQVEARFGVKREQRNAA